MSFEATWDPTIWIEEQADAYVRYRQVIDGEVTRRWEVYGHCKRLGDCIIGSIEPETGELIRDHEHLEELKHRLGAERLISLMDVPIVPGFDSCCVAAGYMSIHELPREG